MVQGKRLLGKRLLGKGLQDKGLLGKELLLILIVYPIVRGMNGVELVM